MEQLLVDAKQFVEQSKEAVKKAEILLSKIKINDGKLELDALVPDENIEDLIELIHENPLILKAVQDSLKPKQTMFVKFLQVYTGATTETLHKVYGAIMGIAGFKICALTANALMPSTICAVLPTGYWAIPAISVIGAAGYMVHKYMPIPTTFFETAISKSIHALSKIAPYIGIGLAESVQATQKQFNLELIQPMARDLLRSITVRQKTLLSQKNILVLAYLFPEVLIHEIKFLNALNEEQIKIIYNLFEARAQHRKSEKFEAFARTVSVDQVSLLKPSNKLLLGLFNPQVIHAAENAEFLKTLTNQQAELLLGAL